MIEKDITEQMKELYDSGLTLAEVGKRFGITRQSVRSRFISRGIAYSKKVKDPNMDITAEMKKLYDSGLTLEAIGKQFGMTKQGVRDRFLKKGIAYRKRIKYSYIDKDRLVMLYTDKRLSIRKIALLFSTTHAVIEKALKLYDVPRREPIKKGGYRVDFLRSLAIGEKKIFVWKKKVKYPYLHSAATLIGIKISIRAQGEDKFEVTRVA